jgi:hypothetical protein
MKFTLDRAFIYTEDFQNEIYRKGFSIGTQLFFFFVILVEYPCVATGKYS